MKHILILLMVLNAILPSASYASAYASNLSKAKINLTYSAQESAQNSEQDITQNDNNTSSQNATVSMSNDKHCHHPDMSYCDMPCCNGSGDGTDSAHSINCDFNCCNSGLVTTAVLPSLPLLVYSHPISLKPVSSSTNLYTQPISPELRPPLA